MTSIMKDIGKPGKMVINNEQTTFLIYNCEFSIIMEREMPRNKEFMKICIREWEKEYKKSHK